MIAYQVSSADTSVIQPGQTQAKWRPLQIPCFSCRPAPTRVPALGRSSGSAGSVRAAASLRRKTERLARHQGVEFIPGHQVEDASTAARLSVGPGGLDRSALALTRRFVQ